MLSELLQTILAPLSTHPYLLMFIGLLIAGELVLLPAIYLAVTGRLDLGMVFVVAVTATMIADAVWYYIGRRLPPERCARIVGRRFGRVVERFEPAFTTRRRSIIVLFVSKFVYGARTTIQVLAGMHKMPVATWFVVNALAVVTLNACLVSLGYLVRGTMFRFGEIVQDLELAFLAFVILSVSVYFLAGKTLGKRWSR